MERKCGNKYGGGLIPTPVGLPDALTGVVKHLKEGTLGRLAVAPRQQHLLSIADREGIVIVAHPSRGPEVYFATPLNLSRLEQHPPAPLPLRRSLIDGFCLTMRGAAEHGVRTSRCELGHPTVSRLCPGLMSFTPPIAPRVSRRVFSYIRYSIWYLRQQSS
jgi:hypothetical protein